MTASRKNRLGGWTRRAILAAAGLFAMSCEPDSNVFGGTITGTVLDQSAQPVGLVTVYIVDQSEGRKEEQVDALSGNNGRFRLDVPAGHWTLVATDFASTAAFVYDVSVGNGEVLDVGPVYLQPCAAPGSGSNGEVYEECPDPSTTDDLGYGVPAAPLEVTSFQPAYTDATLSIDQSGSRLLEVSSYDEGHSIRIDLQIPETSPYFAVGEHSIPEYATDFFATLYDQAGSIIYVFRSGTFTVEALDPEEGGTFRARFSDTTFDWYDYENGVSDGSFTATVAETSPAMTDAISMNEVSPGGGAGPPTQSYTFGTLQPEYTQVYVAPDHTAQVATYDVFESGDYVQLFVDVTAVLNSTGSFAVQNTFGTDPSSWSIELHALASYTDAMGYEYLFVLESGTWNVTDPVTGPGDTFAASLDDATFYWQNDPASPPYSTITLGLESSGTMQGVADPATPDDRGNGRVDWYSLKPGLTVQLGN